ncbi:MAG: phospholipid carrier-dependent glycosyltransferase [Alphaproteobacteria bacterium]|nr:MAG: phospholipid carrier-dependent glycosyltransferase [Alphaproteobacteria bacterium]
MVRNNKLFGNRQLTLKIPLKIGVFHIKTLLPIKPNILNYGGAMLKEMFNLKIGAQNGRGLQKYLSPNILLGLILILGTILRFYGLGVESYWLDEVATTIEARQSIGQLLTVGRLDQPPAYYLPMHFWLRTFGDSEASLRSFSAIAGIGSIILIYLIGRRLFGKEVGLLSAFFMALSDFQISISQEAINYSLF